MPKPIRETPAPRNHQKAKPTRKSSTVAKSGGSVVDRIAPVSPREGMRLLAYGQARTGKTTLAATFPKPLLIIGTEDGTNSVSDVDGVYFVRLEASTELEELARHVGDGQFESVCLDTAKGLEDLLLREILNLGEVPLTRYFGLAGYDEWQAVAAQWKERMRGLFDLVDRQGLKLIILAHERSLLKDKAEPVPGIPYMGPSCLPEVSRYLQGECDYFGYTHRRLKESDSESDAEWEYCLRIGEHDVYQTGCRLPKSYKKPSVIAEPDYEKLKAVLQGEWAEIE